MNRENFSHVTGASTSIIAAITSQQEQIDWLLRQGASSVAIVAGAATIVSIWRKRNKPPEVFPVISVSVDSVDKKAATRRQTRHSRAE